MPPSDGVAARLFDGESARARPVQAWLEEADLCVDDGTRIARDLLTREAAGDRVILHRSDVPDWRLMIDTSDAARFADLPDRHRVTRRHARWIGGATAGAIVAGLLVWTLGDRVVAMAAPLVPRGIAVRAGLPMAEMIAGGDRRCRDPAGLAALDKLVARVMPRRPVEAVTVRIGRTPGVNAFTLPGGQVIVLSGLIAAARSPEEVAGVLAHELGHVQKRHPTQALLRHFGFDLVLQGLGGNIGGLAATGLYLRNSRSAEREADGVALDLMRAGHVAPGGLAAFFKRLEDDPARKPAKDGFGQWASLIATHPSDGSRMARFRATAGAWRVEPVLTGVEWRALQGVCG